MFVLRRIKTVLLNLKPMIRCQTGVSGRPPGSLTLTARLLLLYSIAWIPPDKKHRDRQTEHIYRGTGSRPAAGRKPHRLHWSRYSKNRLQLSATEIRSPSAVELITAHLLQIKYNGKLVVGFTFEIVNGVAQASVFEAYQGGV